MERTNASIEGLASYRELFYSEAKQTAMIGREEEQVTRFSGTTGAGHLLWLYCPILEDREGPDA
jgi:hypothetical protein